MKKIIQACGLIVFSLLLPADLFGQLDNLANMSAEWVRTGNRNASVDGADIVNYNPSGLTILDDGFHINFGNQMLIRNPRHTFDLGFGENTYSHEGMDMLLPNFYAVYKKYRLAIYAGAYVAGGGGAIEYPEGSISTNLIAQQISDNLQIPYNYFKNQNLSGSSYYKAVTAGGTYKLNNLISFSAGGRYINAIKNTVVGMTIEGVGNLPDNEIGGTVIVGEELNLARTIEMDSSPRQALASRAFWHIALALMCQHLVLMATITHVMPYLSSIGIARSTSSLVASAVPLASIVGRIGFGCFSDRVDNRWLSTAGFAMMSLGMLFFSYADGVETWPLVPFFILFGIGYGGLNTMRVVLLSTYFGNRRFGTIYGFAEGIMMVGSVIGPAIAGRVYDNQGSYEGIWFIFAGLSVVALIIMAATPPVNTTKA